MAVLIDQKDHIWCVVFAEEVGQWWQSTAEILLMQMTHILHKQVFGSTSDDKFLLQQNIPKRTTGFEECERSSFKNLAKMTTK